MYVRYQKFSFVRPSTIPMDTYIKLREALVANPNANIEPYSKTFKEQFQNYFKILKTCGLIVGCALVISIPMYEIETINEWRKNGFGYFVDCVFELIALGSMLVIVWVLWYLAIEGSSYSDFQNDKKDYYYRLKHCILSTSSYGEFLIAIQQDKLAPII